MGNFSAPGPRAGFGRRYPRINQTHAAASGLMSLFVPSPNGMVDLVTGIRMYPALDGASNTPVMTRIATPWGPAMLLGITSQGCKFHLATATNSVFQPPAGSTGMAVAAGCYWPVATNSGAGAQVIGSVNNGSLTSTAMTVDQYVGGGGMLLYSGGANNNVVNIGSVTVTKTNACSVCARSTFNSTIGCYVNSLLGSAASGTSTTNKTPAGLNQVWAGAGMSAAAPIWIGIWNYDIGASLAAAVCLGKGGPPPGLLVPHHSGRMIY